VLSPKILFRTLLIASLVFGLASGLVRFIQPGLSEDWQTVLEWDGNGSLFERLEEAPWPNEYMADIVLLQVVATMLLATGAVSFGLFFFWRWARIANVVLTAVFTVMHGGLGLTVQLPIESMFNLMSTISTGAILALTYTSPVKELFERKRDSGQA
jgi:hypothetical protein